MKLHPHQQKIIEFIDNHQKGIVLADMGSGKTISTLAAMTKFEGTTLIVAPINVAKTVWHTEAEKWQVPLRFSLVVGYKPQREKALATPADVYVINVENLQWLENTERTFDNLVIDELSMFKSTGVRYKSLMRMTQNCLRRIGLTGTPVANSLLDLWPQVNVICGKGNNPLSKTKTGYTQRYFFATDYMGYNFKPLPGATEEIFSKLEPLCVRVTGRELPELMVQDIMVDIPRGVYDSMKKDFVSEDITAANAAVLAGKLQQVAQGRVYNDDGEVVRIHDVKQQALLDMLEVLSGAPVIVVYQYKHDLEAIQEICPTAVEFTPKRIDDWNEGKIPVMAMQLRSGSHGLNLQAGGNHLIWYSLTYSHESYAQMNARLHRTGQTKGVIIHRILAKDTIDEAIAKAIVDKSSLQQMLLEYMQN